MIKVDQNDKFLTTAVNFFKQLNHQEIFKKTNTLTDSCIQIIQQRTSSNFRFIYYFQKRVSKNIENKTVKKNTPHQEKRKLQNLKNFAKGVNFIHVKCKVSKLRSYDELQENQESTSQLQILLKKKK